MFTRKLSLPAAFILNLILSFTVQAASTPHWVHYKVLNNTTTLPKKVVVLPADIEVSEVTAGGVEEEVPGWSAEAGKSVARSLSAAIKADGTLTEVKAPRYSKKTSAVLHEHLALYKLVVDTASRTNWEHKIRRFDYSIGPGLKELQRTTGADVAVMVYGRDHVSTTGRKMKAIAGTIPFVNMLTGPSPKLGYSFIHIGMVDLRSGDLLWMNSEYREGASNLRNYEDANDIVGTIFEWYPGIEQYREVYVQ